MTVIDQQPFFEALACVSAAASLEDALDAVERAVSSLGFTRFALVDRPGRTGIRAIHHNAPGAWSGNLDRFDRNPAIQKALASPVPFTWDRQFYERCGAPELWAEQAAHGFRVGICATYGSHDAQAFIVVGAHAEAIPVEPDRIHEYFGNLLLLAGACYATLPAFKMEDEAPSTVRLRPRELECLHWVLMDKTAWEISVILGISERTVNQHLARARLELGVSNTKVAAARAVQLELLPPQHAA